MEDELIEKIYEELSRHFKNHNIGKVLVESDVEYREKMGFLDQDGSCSCCGCTCHKPAKANKTIYDYIINPAGEISKKDVYSIAEKYFIEQGYSVDKRGHGFHTYELGDDSFILLVDSARDEMQLTFRRS